MCSFFSLSEKNDTGDLNCTSTLFFAPHRLLMTPGCCIGQDYKCERWYFEVVDMYRRIVFLGVIPLLGSDAPARAYAGATLALVSTVFFRELTPYRYFIIKLQ